MLGEWAEYESQIRRGLHTMSIYSECRDESGALVVLHPLALLAPIVCNRIGDDTRCTPSGDQTPVPGNAPPLLSTTIPRSRAM